MSEADEIWPEEGELLVCTVKGVKENGGTPREFCTITVTDGIAMGHEGMKSSLISREIIADSAELTVRGHCYDALVGIAGCDKSLSLIHI